MGVKIKEGRGPFRGWAGRGLPADGFFDHRAFFGALDAAGYDGWFDVEVFSDDGRFGDEIEDSVWKRDPFEVASETVETFARLWDERTASS